VAASTVIVILLRRWFPAEENERHQQEKHMREMAENIAGLKETKELVRRSRDEFEMRLKEQTAELKNEILVRQEMESELQTAIEKVERTNSEFEQFSYVVSHDLQEPLRMISSYMQLLERRYRGQLDDDADEFIDFAVDGAKRMQILIADLLAYSRVGTRGKPFGPTDSGRVLDQTLTNFGELIAENGATVTHDALPTVMVDGVQLKQVFQNLLSNAIKFQGVASPEIHIGAERMNGEWLFSVRDNGIGIESEYFEKIFVIFRRLHTRQEYPGTGIGLALSKRIIERHGGRIWVESEPGKGATFHFTIPDGT
jgi:light-regulated signal transduction histidine kinase (bacteriophytochrome)